MCYKNVKEIFYTFFHDPKDFSPFSAVGTLFPSATLKVNRRRKSYVTNMQNRTDLSIGVRQYGVGLFIFSLSTHLPGAALPPETGVVSALTLTAVPVSGCL